MKILGLRRGHYAATISILLIVLAIAALMAGTAGCGGSSSSAIKIRTWYDLNDIRDAMNQNYILMNDLDSTTAGYAELASPTANEGQGWEPIGGHEWGNVFYGSFDGNGYKICDLFINRPLQNDVALFGAVGQGALLIGAIRNVGVVNFTVTGNINVGGLVGGSWQMLTVSNCYAAGNVTGNENVGGLMANNPGTVSHSYFTGSVTGNNSVGGLVGWHHGGTVSDCYATGSVSGGGQVGGLVGFAETGTVTNCHATGNVTGLVYVGGLAGYAEGNVSDCYATGSVIGSQQVGGLAGDASNVSNCYATGNVTGTGGGAIGGLVGWHDDGAVSYSYATGSVAGNYSGGLVGVNGNNWLRFEPMSLSDTATIYYSYSTGSVTGSICVGGLVGENYVSTAVVSCYSTGSAAGNNMTGGLVGFNAGNVTESYATGGVTGNDRTGGLVGYDSGGTVTNSFWDTQTSGQGASAGGTGENTTQLKDFDTFDGAGWSIITVANPSTRNSAYIWNIVDDVTYPFLSWQPV